MKRSTNPLDPKASTRYHIELEPNTRYHQITFGGCGFLLAYHFGAIICMFDNGISTDNAVGISGGSMAALAMLRGSDIYVGLRQGIVDLVNEACGMILLGLNMLFMNYYFQYMWNFRCLHLSHTDAKRLSTSTQSCDFPLHDMSPSHRVSAKDLNGRYHVQMVSIAAQDPTGNALDPLAQTVAGSYLDDSFWRLSAIPGGFGRALRSMLVPVVIEEYADDSAIVQAACLSGGIPGITTFWPRYFDEHFCCLDRMTSAPISINSSTADLTSFINQTQSSSNSSITSLIPGAESAGGGGGGDKQQQGKTSSGRVSSYTNMTETELSEAVKEASEVHEHTIVISPIMHDYAVFRGSDIGLCGGYVNPFPVFPWQLDARKKTFVAGYRDMQRRIRNPKILDPLRSEEVSETVTRSGHDNDHDNAGVPLTVTKTVDSEETISELIDFILYDSYAKDWKNPHFAMRVDGEFMATHEAPQNCALSNKEIAIAGTVFLLFVGLMLWHPVYFLAGMVSVLAVGAVWIISYLLGVDRINRDVERKHQEDTEGEREEGAYDSSGGEEGECMGMAIDTDEEEEEKEEFNGSIYDDSTVTGAGLNTTSPVSPPAPSPAYSHRILRSATKQKTKQKYL